MRLHNLLSVHGLLIPNLGADNDTALITVCLQMGQLVAQLAMLETENGLTAAYGRKTGGPCMYADRPRGPCVWNEQRAEGPALRSAMMDVRSGRRTEQFLRSHLTVLFSLAEGDRSAPSSNYASLY